MTELSWAEMVMAAHVGLTRFSASRSRDRKLTHAARHTSLWFRLGEELRGSMAECLQAKALGLYWPGAVDTFQGEADIPGWGDVRSTGRWDGCLILHPEDPDDRPVALVTGDPGRQVLAGYVPAARVGKRPEFWRDDRGVISPAWFVPQHVLRQWP